MPSCVDRATIAGGEHRAAVGDDALARRRTLPVMTATLVVSAGVAFDRERRADVLDDARADVHGERLAGVVTHVEIRVALQIDGTRRRAIIGRNRRAVLSGPRITREPSANFTESRCPTRVAYVCAALPIGGTMDADWRMVNMMPAMAAAARSPPAVTVRQRSVRDCSLP